MHEELLDQRALHRANNWMQGIEGELDTIHAAFLHSAPNRVRVRGARHLRLLHAPSRMHGDFSVRETDHGTSYGMYRPAEDDTYYWRVGHLLFPFYAMPPGASDLGEDARFLAYVPMDDYHTLEWSGRACARRHVQAQGSLRPGVHPQRHGLVRPLPHRAEPGERLQDRPRGPEARRQLHRHPGHPPAGHGDDRDAWARSWTARTSTSARRTR